MSDCRDYSSSYEYDVPETYSESARRIVITAERARQEIESHGASWTEFMNDDFGHRKYNRGECRYLASDILTWLGY